MDNFKFPILYKKNSKGKIMEWEVEVQDLTSAGEGFAVSVIHGQQGGKKQLTSTLVKEGKNIGKVNETSPYQQAKNEAESKWQCQIDREGYVQDISLIDTDQRGGFEPMLAHRYDKYPEKIVFPVATQRKYDGNRCVSIVENGVAKLFSRKREEIKSVPHINRALEKLFPVGIHLIDGELYNHSYHDKFEELMSFIRMKLPKKGYEVVEYHIYDLAYKDLTYEKRWELLKVILPEKIGPLVPVETVIVNNEEEMFKEFKKSLADKYEGLMLRNLLGVYEGKRSYDLQKVKEMADDEFEIIGVSEGKGKMRGHAIFECKMQDGQTFECKMKGSMDKLKEYFDHPETCIGKMLTVQYQNFTEKGLPRFPVGLRFRED